MEAKSAKLKYWSIGQAYVGAFLPLKNFTPVKISPDFDIWIDLNFMFI